MPPSIVICAKDSEFGYYDSKLAPKCPGLGKRDVLKGTVAAAAAHHLPVIAYCVMQGCGYGRRDHPEWRMIGADGKEINRICFNSTSIEVGSDEVPDGVLVSLSELAGVFS